MISAIILTKNEEKNIVDCLETLLWCDEIVVIDDFSEDMTLEAVRTFHNPKIHIFQHKLDNDFATQRNFSLSKAKGEWVLFVDADERVSEALASEISNIKHPPAGRAGQISNKEYNGFYIRRLDTIWGRKLEYGETGHIKLLRFARKGAGVWRGRVHEVWDIKGKIGVFNNYLVHYPHKSVTEFLQEINVYSTIRAHELFENRVQVRWWSVLLYPFGKFLFNYIVRRGFLDGLAGFVLALIMSFHSFLVRGKLWILNENRMKRLRKDVFVVK